MASYMLYGAENLLLLGGRKAPNGLSFMGSEINGLCFPKMGILSYGRNAKSNRTQAPKCSLSSSRPISQPRFIQHKKEAYWFYRFISIVYDHIINPGHWTEEMRDEALEPADLNDKNLIVLDVGGGTGFTTLGIVKHVKPQNIAIIDQSPHQLAKAKQKEALRDCKFIEGDAEDLRFRTDYADRYVSAGRVTLARQTTITQIGRYPRRILVRDFLIHCELRAHLRCLPRTCSSFTTAKNATKEPEDLDEKVEVLEILQALGATREYRTEMAHEIEMPNEKERKERVEVPLSLPLPLVPRVLRTSVFPKVCWTYGTWAQHLLTMVLPREDTPLTCDTRVYTPLGDSEISNATYPEPDYEVGIESYHQE